jgi:hypothetical protein
LTRSHDNRIAAIQSEIKAINKRYSESIGTREGDVQGQLEAYDEELKQVDSKFNEQLEESKRTRDNEFIQLASNTSIVVGLETSIDALSDRRIGIREEINQRVGDNQIYRTAQMFYGIESAADLRRDQVTNIAMIWFGSLAALVALTGIILAMASLVIRDPRLLNYTPRSNRSLLHHSRKLLDSGRRFFLRRRRAQRKPIIKEVVQKITTEVPVDRVVKTEVPVEIIRKEIVHVPFYTNDEKLLKIQDSASKI